MSRVLHPHLLSHIASCDAKSSMLTRPWRKILEQPASYVPIRTPARKLLATPTPYGGSTPGRDST